MKNDAGRIENDDDRSFHSHKDFFCDAPRIMQRQNELYVNKNEALDLERWASANKRLEDRRADIRNLYQMLQKKKDQE